MKKLVVAALISAVVVLASCSTYTCPTYSKAPKAKTHGEAKI